jgi:hypothetical protein
MIVSGSVGSLSRKFDHHTNPILMRTDGFKNVFKGLSYKQSASKPNVPYTSLGKRSHPNIAKEHESKLEDEDNSKQFRRTQTAEIGRYRPETR